MGIEIRQQGEPELFARAGVAIGAANKAQKEQEMAFQREQVLLDIQERRRQEQVSNEWELQKMLLRSQQEFSHEQRLKQVQLEAEARSQEWEVEKMEINSKIDFEKEIQDRQKKIASTSTLLESVKKARESGKYSNEQLDSLELKYNMELAAIKSGTEINVPSMKPSTKIEKPIFSPYNVQKGLGVLSTGAPESPLGIPLPTLTNKEEHEKWAERNWGPDWKLHVPEAVEVINKKFGIVGLKTLNLAAQQQFLMATGGNIEKAKELARQNGYKVD